MIRRGAFFICETEKTKTKPIHAPKRKPKRIRTVRNRIQQINGESGCGAMGLADKIQQNTTRENRPWIFGKDEVASSNLASSSKINRLNREI